MISDNSKKEGEESGNLNIREAEQPSADATEGRGSRADEGQGEQRMDTSNGSKPENPNSIQNNKEAISCESKQAPEAFQNEVLTHEGQKKTSCQLSDKSEEGQKTQNQVSNTNERVKKEKIEVEQQNNGEF